MLSTWTVLLSGLLLFSAAAQSQTRIASLNIAKKHGTALIEAIRNQPELRKADVVMLQEIVDSPHDHVASEIAAALDLHVEFAPAIQLNTEYAEGLAILSRYPLSQTETIRLPAYDLHFRTTERIALLATVESPLGPIRVINTHLDDRINEDSERRQLAPIWESASRFRGPCVIGGDFNSNNIWWGAHVLPVPGLQHQAGMIRNEMAKRGFSTPLGSGPATYHLPGLKLDWIYLRGLKTEDSGVTPIRFSDHNSVWVTVGVR